MQLTASAQKIKNMYKHLFLVLAILMAVPTVATAQKKKKKKKKGESELVLSTKLDSLSYAIGVNLATSLKADGIDSVNARAVIQAFRNTMNGVEDSLMSKDAVKKNYGSWIAEARNEATKRFFEKNGKREGITTTASGMQYEVLVMGAGDKPTLENKVKTHYHGTLFDGTVFDSSVDRGEPISFPLRGVIKGWQEGLQLMPIGSKFRFWIPHELAYGPRGVGKIKPYSTLIFEVELIAIEQ